jgi:hypothetical protein
MLAAGFSLLASSCFLSAQAVGPTQDVAASVELPESPNPALTLESAELEQQASPAQDAPASAPQSTASPAPPATAAPAQSSSTQQTPAPQSSGQKSQHDIADQQVHEQEKQRVLGIVPAFNTSYRSDAVALTAGQKLNLAFHSATDPESFGAAFVIAGYHEALDEDPGFRWGVQGYMRRSGAAYLDTLDGIMIGNGIFPALFHQDPRYFRLGHGTTRHRILYALATNVICKGDKTRNWQPNYSNVLGNITAGAISNLYYPPSNTGVGLTISNGLIQTAVGGFGSLFEEFWPDISRKFLHKDPTHGLDAESRAKDEASKQATEGSR